MSTIYLFHRILTAPLKWREVAERLSSTASSGALGESAALYGIWRAQIGRPRDELTAITIWDGPDGEQRSAAWFEGARDISSLQTEAMTPTLRPLEPSPPQRQGNYAFRDFTLPMAHWDEFLELCSGAWPGFESSYDSQIIGLWRYASAPTGECRALLLTRRPSLAMWERSKLPASEAEAEVRRKLSRRYDLCSSTVVCTTTLLTAADTRDDARWT